MTGKEKIALALNHKPEPVPLDFGSTSTTGIHVMVHFHCCTAGFHA